MKFKLWLETEVYHGSKRQVNQWDHSKQISGYYPGFYAWPDIELAKNHGNYIYSLNVDDSKFFKLINSDELKRKAAESGFRVTSGSGYPEVEYLKSLGYEGIIRGKEYIIFNPEKWAQIPVERNVE